jgi:hypothetical protein
MKVLHQGELAEAILAMFEKEDDLRCAVAFWGPTMAKRARKRGATVILDLSMRGTTRNALKALGVKRKATPALIGERVRVLDRFHAKLYLGRDAAIVGSANASANALGRDGRKPALWEAGVLIERAKEPAAYKQAEDLWKAFLGASRAVDSEDLDRAPLVASMASARDFDDAIATVSPSVLNAVLRRPDDFQTTAFIFGDHDVSDAEHEVSKGDYQEVHGEAPQSKGRSLICIFWDQKPGCNTLRTALNVVMFWFGSQAGIYAYHDIVTVDNGGRFSFFGKRHWPTVSAAIGLPGVGLKEAWDADRARGEHMAATCGQPERSRFVVLSGQAASAWLENPGS